MDGLVRSGDAGLFDFAALYLRTRAILREHLDAERLRQEQAAAFLAERTLPHLEAMRLGLRWTVRAEHGPVAELRYVVGPDVGTDDPSDTREGRDLSEADIRCLAALLHAKVVMGWLPGLPREATTYPGPWGYRDIRPPRGPGELKDRLEELERGVWEVATGTPRPHIQHGRYRRVYAFFEAGAWLALQQSRHVGGLS
jgi:hypothetical protein